MASKRFYWWRQIPEMISDPKWAIETTICATQQNFALAWPYRIVRWYLVLTGRLRVMLYFYDPSVKEVTDAQR